MTVKTGKSGKSGLIPVKRTVVRNGKAFQQTVYVKAKYENKVEKKNVEVPEWDFQNPKDFEDELTRINKLADRSERRILKEELLRHIDKDLGLSWDKVNVDEDKAFMRNCMRAYAVLKKNLQNGPIPNKTKEAKKAAAKKELKKDGKQSLTVTQSEGEDYVMDRDASKKLARDFRDQHGMDVVMDFLRSNGLSWSEVPDAGPNQMRAMRRLASFIRKGGKVETQVTSSETKKKAPEDKPAKAEEKKKYKEGSIEADFEKATPRQKTIALSTGMLPLDDDTADFLEGLIKSNEMGFLGNEQDYGLPKRLNEEADYFGLYVSRDNDTGSGAKRYDFTKYNTRHLADKMFRGSDMEKDYNEYKENVKKFVDKYDYPFDYTMGVNGTRNNLELFETLDEMAPEWDTKAGMLNCESFGRKLINASGSEVERLWDKLEIDDLLGHYLIYNNSRSGVSNIENIINILHVSANDTTLEEVIYNLNGKDGPSIKDKIRKGELTKKTVLEEIGHRMVETASLRGSAETGVSRLATSFWGFSKNPHISRIAGEIHRKKATKSEVMDTMREMLVDYAPLSTPEADAVMTNITMARVLESAYEGGIKEFDVEPISKETLFDSSDLMHTVKVHLGAARKKTEKAKKAYLAKFSMPVDNRSHIEALKGDKDTSKLEFPSPDDAKKIIKSSLYKVPDKEASLINQKVQETHDRKNHSSFETKVKGVYAVKRIANEEKFDNINAKINTTGFYYHGTSASTAQKILGNTGGFRIFKKGDSRIKVGSMLGYGLYLASESSKSVQYAGNGFSRGNSRGVLFLCKASLGNVKETRYRGAEANQQIMNQKDTDTVFMDRPHVVNPEWAVKREEQAIPKLWIDIERVDKRR